MRDGQLVYVAWTGIRKSIQTSEAGSRCRVQLEEPGLLIYDCWAPESLRGQDSYQTILDELSANDCQGCGSAWVYCREENVPSRRAIENAGFELRYRLKRDRWLSTIERSFVHQV
jgi:RimJ/RimL family protein N-acetyltransferase